MLKILIIGASGYVGVELAIYLSKHPKVSNITLSVSKNSKDAHFTIDKIHKKLKNIINLKLEPLIKPEKFAKNVDVVFFATDHIVSHTLVPLFLSYKCIVFDLSGAFRIKKKEIYTQFYNFQHQHPELLNSAIYGLAEFVNVNEIKKKSLIAIPGCYPTAIQIGLKPLVLSNLLDLNYLPVVNAISGISGAGKNPPFKNSSCETGLTPYKLFQHRHQPEIETHLGIPIIFNPHLGSFCRGIIATITCRLKKKIQKQKIFQTYYNYYSNKPLIRLYEDNIPNLISVIGLPFCDLGFITKKQYIVIVVTEDNLLKGAASQAIQCFNIKFGSIETTSLI
ncbi:N-acetyl-gamma-glutamyl-phosphate reductase [Buchnera aphidicola (Thelaxes californica)]|uniref:N-acetyl-gamma-glutamyl-phosphate reductase n=1 Tax=Buchnera aphidicola (Thelaxes californica) TaxID=1315998 RepID=A0A4D6YA10_9GAMM|nr:N-acetyl-gamma-glutamyl-phosphate reductase [Buchnera aphidicola]QCI26597.1 N-acetyl-gamma-glutamyl-phosphate reductase [Buchnera aphidicola (Thelaxes californica)]